MLPGYAWNKLSKDPENAWCLWFNTKMEGKIFPTQNGSDWGCYRGNFLETFKPKFRGYREPSWSSVLWSFLSNNFPAWFTKVAWIVLAIWTISEFVRRKYLSLFLSIKVLHFWCHSFWCNGCNDAMIKRIWHWNVNLEVLLSRHPSLFWDLFRWN